MLILSLIMASLAGGIGAITRYSTDQAIQSWLAKRHETTEMAHLGIVSVNLLGCALAGFIFGLTLDAHHPTLTALIGAFLSGYTTFSTAMVDVLKMHRKGFPWRAFKLWIGPLLACLIVAYLGALLGRLLGNALV
ncbi:fluoride efflux transporter FluC [Boudabousia marimammalium]|uniref:Fluoride-specific ion channel n=1 Tax=Boudabousia marimammalium TaxID=156892 RepID=A0A1Q5PSQ0_9ACTO|nr:CrcB family protein [Boudabousia marimammalium]OKL50601.1 hypothetical protein BM477_01185 [Boudabousia marimammalium]